MCQWTLPVGLPVCSADSSWMHRGVILPSAPSAELQSLYQQLPEWLPVFFRLNHLPPRKRHPLPRQMPSLPELKFHSDALHPEINRPVALANSSVYCCLACDVCKRHLSFTILYPPYHTDRYLSHVRILLTMYLLNNIQSTIQT